MTSFNYAIQTQAPSLNIFGPRIIESGFPTPKKALNFLLSEVGQSARVVRIVPQTGEILPQTDYINPQIPSKTMTTTQHTPGPWRLWKDQDPKEPLAVVDANTDFTCTIAMENTNAAANARLIAAAPELLHALKCFIADAEDGEATHDCDGNEFEVVKLARAAIAKATETTGEN